MSTRSPVQHPEEPGSPGPVDAATEHGATDRAPAAGEWRALSTDVCGWWDGRRITRTVAWVQGAWVDRTAQVARARVLAGCALSVAVVSPILWVLSILDVVGPGTNDGALGKLAFAAGLCGPVVALALALIARSLHLGGTGSLVPSVVRAACTLAVIDLALVVMGLVYLVAYWLQHLPFVPEQM